MKAEIIGRKFHRLLVLESAGRSANKSILVRCRCDCGAVKVVRLCALLRSEIKSCGCLRRELSASQKSTLTHGCSHSPTYASWAAMKFRCTNPNHVAYKHYGGRGISVCPSWSNSFANFLADLGERPVGFTLDRINPDGNYEPGNCRWVSPKIQGNNRRSNRMLRSQGLMLTVAEWSEVTGIKMTTIRERLKRGWSVERALQ
jgi:hypothetical protein